MQVLPAELGAADPIPTATPGRSPAAPSQFLSTAMRWQHRPLLELEQGRNCTSQPILLLQTAARQAKAVWRERPPEQGEEDGLGRDLRHGAGAAALSLSQCPSGQHPALGMLTLQQSCCLPPACRASLPQPFWGSLAGISIPPPCWGREWSQPSPLPARSPPGSRGSPVGWETAAAPGRAGG